MPQVAPLPAIKSAITPNSYVGMQEKVVNGGGTLNQGPLIVPAPPVIGLISVGNSNIVITVSNHATNQGNMYSYQVYVNDAPYGQFVPDGLNIKITGLPNNYLYRIKIRALAAGWQTIQNGGSISNYVESNFSNEVSGTPSISLAPKSAPSMNSNHVDIKYVSSNVYQKCIPTGISQYSEVYNGDTYYTNPIHFQPNMLIGTFTAEATLKARVHYGGNDYRYGGGVYYSFSDLKINIDTNPFTDLLSFDLREGETYTDGDTLAQMYDRKIIELGLTSQDVTFAGDFTEGMNHFNIDIASQLKKEFVIAKPYIAEKLKKSIKNNVAELIRSSDGMRAFLDITNLNIGGMRTYAKDFIIPYEGLIHIKPHIIAATFKAGDRGTTTFSYAMIDTNRATTFIKENVSASVILASPQSADSFTFTPLKGLLDQSDVFGPTDEDFGTPLNYN